MRINLVVTAAAAVVYLAGFGLTSMPVSADAPAAKKTTQTATAAPQATPVAVPQPYNVVVKSGDSLSSIASANNTTYVRIYDANIQISDPDMIYPGQILSIPTANQQLAARPLPNDAPVQPVVSNSPQTTAAVAEPATPVPAATASVSSSGNGVWDELAACESGGNWAINTGNGFYGGLQFTISSWEATGGSGLPSQASPAEQIARAQILQSRQGWGAWPACSSKLGL